VGESKGEPLPAVLTLAEVAKVLRCSKAHVSHLVNGKIRGVPILPSVRCGRRTLVRQQVMIAWMKARESESSKSEPVTRIVTRPLPATAT